MYIFDLITHPKLPYLHGEDVALSKQVTILKRPTNGSFSGHSTFVEHFGTAKNIFSE